MKLFLFLFLALASILCSGAKQFEQFWEGTPKGTILSCLVKICPVVTEEMLIEVFSIFSSGRHLCSRAEWFEQGTILSSLIEIRPVVTEDVI